MGLVVTALSQDGNLAPLRKLLEDASLSLDPLQAIGPDESTESVARGIISTDYMSGGGQGTGVPGINSGGSSFSGLGSGGGSRFFRNESLADRLGDFEIPDSETDNYVEALERGRTVVAYFAHDDTVEQIKTIFKEAGLLNVTQR